MTAPRRGCWLYPGNALRSVRRPRAVGAQRAPVHGDATDACPPSGVDSRSPWCRAVSNASENAQGCGNRSAIHALGRVRAPGPVQPPRRSRCRRERPLASERPGLPACPAPFHPLRRCGMWRRARPSGHGVQARGGPPSGGPAAVKGREDAGSARRTDPLLRWASAADRSPRPCTRPPRPRPGAQSRRGRPRGNATDEGRLPPGVRGAGPVRSARPAKPVQFRPERTRSPVGHHAGWPPNEPLVPTLAPRNAVLLAARCRPAASRGATTPGPTAAEGGGAGVSSAGDWPGRRGFDRSGPRLAAR